MQNRSQIGIQYLEIFLIKFFLCQINEKFNEQGSWSLKKFLTQLLLNLGYRNEHILKH